MFFQKIFQSKIVEVDLLKADVFNGDALSNVVALFLNSTYKQNNNKNVKKSGDCV